jgi:hypothetical protein
VGSGRRLNSTRGVTGRRSLSHVVGMIITVRYSATGTPLSVTHTMIPSALVYQKRRLTPET